MEKVNSLKEKYSESIPTISSGDGSGHGSGYGSGYGDGDGDGDGYGDGNDVDFYIIKEARK